MALGAVMAGAAFIKLTLDDASLQKGLDRAKTSMKALKTSFEIATTELAAAFTAINVPIVGAMKSFAAFDDTMRMVQAVTGATGKAFDTLTEQAKRLGRETSFTASEVSAGMLALGRMGLNTDEIGAAIQPMMNLARVTGTDLAQAAEIAANNMRVFGMTSEDMTQISDILSVTANSSAQTLTDLGEALKMAGPHAKRAGADLKDTAASIGILANMGIRGSLAGTALGKSYKKLADPKTIDFLKAYGVETLNADGSMRRMRDTLADIARAMSNMTNAEQITFAEKVFDARGSLGGGTLAVNVDAIDALVQKLDEAEGEAQRAADLMENGIGGALRKLASAAEGVSLAFGELISVSFAPVVQWLSDACGWLRKIIQENAKAIGSFSKGLYLLLAIGTAAKILFVIGGVIGKIIAPFKAVLFLLDAGVVALGKWAAAEGVASAATSVAAKRAAVYGTALGKLSAQQLFLAATSTKHAATVLAASVTNMVAAKMAAGASALRAAGYYAEAVAAKVTAAAVVVLKMALDALLAHPVTVALAAGVAILSVFALRASAAAKEMRAFADAAEKAADEATELREKGDTGRQNAMVDFDRLKQLEEISKKGRLTASQMQEAEKLMKNLAQYGSAYWASLDKGVGSLSLAADAQDQMNRKMKETARLQIQAEITALEAEKKALDAETESLYGWSNHNLLAQITGRQDEAVRQIEENGGKSTAILQKIYAARNRLKMLDENDQNAITGGDGKTTAERIQEQAEIIEQETVDLEKAEKRLKEMDEDLAKSRRSSLENEIAEIQKLREEYQKNIDALIESKKEEQKRARELDDWQRSAALAGEIGGLEFDRDQAMKGYDKMEAAARKKDAARQEKDRRGFSRFLDDLEKDAQEKALGRDLDAMNKAKDYTGLQSYLSVLIDGQSQALNAAVSEYNAKLAAFLDGNSEGGADLTDTEKDVLHEIQDAINDAQGRMDDYTERLERAQDAAAEAAGKTDPKVVGSWSLAALDQIFDTSAQDRTANATETMVSQQERQIAIQDKSYKMLTKLKEEKLSYA